MWILWLVVSMVLISATQFANRHFGMCWTSYMIYCVVCIFVTGWCLPLAYQLAPTLYHPWFLSIGILSIAGFLGSVFIFHDAVSLWNYAGGVVILIGSGMMLIK